MGLTNHQYDLLINRFDEKRMQSRYDLDRRIEEVYSAVPEIREIDKQIAADSIRRARLAIRGDKEALKGIDEDNATLKQKKIGLLTRKGYPQDYLDLSYSCPVCRDTGYVDGRQCTCFKKALMDLIYKDSNLAEILREENFDRFNYELFSDDPKDTDPVIGMTPRENIKRAEALARDFVRNFDDSYSNLLIYGNTGVGKTFLCSCIAKELLDSSHSVIYYTAYKFFHYLENAKFHLSDSDDETTLGDDYLIDCDLLMIDDLGTELTNSFTSSALFSVINERALRRRSTVISTNLSLSDLDSRYSERIFSRINKDYTFIKIIGRDIRCL